MTTHTKPGLRPANPNFSSGPCAKRPGWSVEALRNAALGRSHRAKIGKTKLEQAI
ncbi:phosphoserine aminotransferase, partial [Mesorhizobium sp. M7A.F.Ca.US.005.03.2.1]